MTGRRIWSPPRLERRGDSSHPSRSTTSRCAGIDRRHASAARRLSGERNVRRRPRVMGGLSRAGSALLRFCAVAGPAPLAVLAALYAGGPSAFFLAAGIGLALAILACDAWIVARRRWITGVLALATQIAFLIFLGTYAASPFPAPSPLPEPLPAASPPAGMAIYVLPTGVNHRTSA